MLNELIEKRHELALLLGFKNYAALSTSDKMAKTPEHVLEFLESLTEKLMSKVRHASGLLG